MKRILALTGALVLMFTCCLMAQDSTTVDTSKIIITLPSNWDISTPKALMGVVGLLFGAFVTIIYGLHIEKKVTFLAKIPVKVWRIAGAVVPILAVGFKFGFDLNVWQAIGAAFLALFTGNGIYDNGIQPFNKIEIKSQDQA